MIYRHLANWTPVSDVNAEKCVAPNESGSNRDYCAINRFNITALANGGKGND